jgi:hypothetical protein
VNALHVTGDSAAPWPDDDDIATKQYVDSKITAPTVPSGVVVAGCGSDTYYNCSGCWGGATCGSFSTAMTCPSGTLRSV